MEVVHRTPVAAFSATPTQGPAPLEVSFQNFSQFANHPSTPFEWNFDLGAALNEAPTSTAENPAHTYEDPGTFGVSLTARNASGVTHEAHATIQVDSPATPAPDPLDGDPNSVLALHSGLSEETSMGQAILYSGQIEQAGMRLARIANPGGVWGDYVVAKHDALADFPASCSDTDSHVALPGGDSLEGEILMEIFGGNSELIDVSNGLQITVCRVYAPNTFMTQVPDVVRMDLWLVPAP